MRRRSRKRIENALGRARLQKGFWEDVGHLHEIIEMERRWIFLSAIFRLGRRRTFANLGSDQSPAADGPIRYDDPGIELLAIGEIQLDRPSAWFVSRDEIHARFDARSGNLDRRGGN